jgi:drug/metabolite transporter (DMT)-like permease
MLEWYYLAIASGAIASITALIEKHVLNAEHATSFTAVTTIGIMLISLLFLPFISISLSAYQLFLIFIASIGFAGSALFIARLYRHGDVSGTTPITSTLPIMFLAVAALVFLGEALSVLQYAGMIILILAIYMMLSDTGKNIPTAFLKKNILYFIASALCYVMGATILKYELAGISPYTFLIISEIFMSAIMLSFVFARFKTFKYLIRDVKAYKNEIFLFSAANVAYTVLYYIAAVTAPISLVYPLRSGVTTIMAVFASGILLKEKITKRIPLALVMIVAMYLLVV